MAAKARDGTLPASLELRAAADDVTEIDIFGEIGFWGVSADNFNRMLKAVNTSVIRVNIDSPGGDVFDGIAIYNLLAQHKARVEVRVMGLAASAASIIAMSGDRVTIADNAFLMIHNAWAIGVGNSAELAQLSDTLDKIDNSLAETYEDRTGLPLATIREMMDAETWLSARDAVDDGFADATFSDDEEEAPAAKAAAFDLTRFRNVPRALRAKSRRSAKTSKKEAPVTAPVADLSPLSAALKQLQSTIKGDTSHVSSRKEAHSR